jgi:anti-sigma B factor antagonist
LPTEPLAQRLNQTGYNMQFSSRRFADVVVASPVGRIDHASAAPFEAALLPLLAQSSVDKEALLLDFAGVEYISSVGLRVLMAAAKQARAHESSIAVASLQPIVAEIFGISRFDRILDLYPSVADALARLSVPALEAFNAVKGQSAT